MVLASAPVMDQSSQPKLTGDAIEPETAPRAARPVSEMIHVASYSLPEGPAAAKPVAAKPAATKPAAAKPEAEPKAKVARSAPATKLVKTATADPLGPLSGTTAKAKGSAPTASAGGSSRKPQSKDSVTDR